MKAILRHFGKFTPRRLLIPDGLRFIFIVYTNRSGSNFLADAIASSGKINFAGEFFNRDVVIDHSIKEKFSDIEQYFEFLIRHIAKNSILCAKLSVHHLDILIASGIMDQILRYSTFVHITRDRVLEQAVSFDIARQTNRWTSHSDVPAKESDLEFSRDSIEAVIRSIEIQNIMIKRFMVDNKITPISISYEDLIDNPQKILWFIGGTLAMPGITYHKERIMHERQSNHINAAWIELYLNGNGYSPKHKD